MWTLAVETATQHGSVALLRERQCLAARSLEAGSYAALLVNELQTLLAEQGLELNQVGLLAVANGPGSFTGVRIGLATVKALMESLRIPAVAVGTLAAVAAGGGDGPALTALEAGRGEVYYGVYPAAVEGVESGAAFGLRLGTWTGAALTLDAGLAAAHPRLRTLDPILAPAVGRLGFDAWQTDRNAAASALTLDARYLGARWER